jgi:hypothetical protein
VISPAWAAPRHPTPRRWAQGAENQIVIAYEVYNQRPSDSDVLVGAIETQTHRARLERTPHLVAADAAFYSAKNEATAKAKGVKRVCIPNRSTKSSERKREQRKCWFRNRQKWRTGSEGRISVVKRRHGLNRSRYKGTAGMKPRLGQSARPVSRLSCPLTSRQVLSDEDARPDTCRTFSKKRCLRRKVARERNGRGTSVTL